MKPKRVYIKGGEGRYAPAVYIYEAPNAYIVWSWTREKGDRYEEAFRFEGHEESKGAWSRTMGYVASHFPDFLK